MLPRRSLALARPSPYVTLPLLLLMETCPPSPNPLPRSAAEADPATRT
jgi:hypothetical protein